MKAISQIEERLRQLSVDEQLQLISRMADWLRGNLNNSMANEGQQEIREFEPDATATDPAGWSDRLSRYREIAQSIVQMYAGWSPRNDTSTKLMIDLERDQFVVMRIGWENDRRVYHTVIHLDIINSKFWIQYDGTNRPVADALLEAGVPREDIVLAFHPPEVRQYTDFAAA